MENFNEPIRVVNTSKSTKVFGKDAGNLLFTMSKSSLNEREQRTYSRRIVSCVNAMEGIEDPIKMRETWDIVKQLELDAYKKVREENDHLLSLLIDLMEGWCKGHSIAPNSAIAYNVGIALSKHDKLIFDGKSLSTAQCIHLIKDRTKSNNMKQRPILFSTPMVQAIMDGRKTQTRRIVNQLVIEHNDGITYDRCPYGEPRDIIWVKETFYAYGKWAKNGKTKGGIQKYKFVDLTLERGRQYLYVDCAPERTLGLGLAKIDGLVGWFKRPSLFMPKHAARIWLRITNVRVARLHEITEKDAIQEGIEIIHYAEHKVPIYRKYNRKERIGTTNPIVSFASLWEFINGEESWLQNPWVWVIEFERIEI